MAVTVSSFTFDYSRAGAGGYLRFYADAEFMDPDGVYHPAQTAGRGDYMKEVAFPVAANVATVPTFTIPATWDEAAGVRASVTVYVLDANRNKVGPLVSNFRIPTLPSTTTWGALLTYNEDVATIRDTSTYTKTQTDYQIEQAVGAGNPATTTTLGKVKVSATPADAASPVAVGTNDPRVAPISPSPAGTFTAANITLDDYGRVLVASDGASGGTTTTYNVKDYNAVGDGVTDDTAAIQAAIDDAVADGGTVEFPPGRYLVEGSGSYVFLVESVGIRIVGHGSYSSIIVKSTVPTTRDIFYFRPPLSSTGHLGDYPGGRPYRQFRWLDLNIEPQSGRPGRYALHFDLAGANYRFMTRAYIAGSTFGELDNANIYFNNNGASQLNGFSTSVIERNTFMCGIVGDYVGDTLAVRDNDFRGHRFCLDVTMVTGATTFLFEHNNTIANQGLRARYAAITRISDCIFEIGNPTTDPPRHGYGSDGAIINLEGAAGTVHYTSILHNALLNIPPATPLKAVRINVAKFVEISRNIIDIEIDGNPATEDNAFEVTGLVPGGASYVEHSLNVLQGGAGQDLNTSSDTSSFQGGILYDHFQSFLLPGWHNPANLLTGNIGLASVKTGANVTLGDSSLYFLGDTVSNTTADLPSRADGDGETQGRLYFLQKIDDTYTTVSAVPDGTDTIGGVNDDHVLSAPGQAVMIAGSNVDGEWYAFPFGRHRRVVSTSLNFAQLLAGGSESKTVTVTGVADDQTWTVSVSTSHTMMGHNSTSTFTAWVSGTDTVTVRRAVINADGSDPAAATFRVVAEKV